MSNLKDITCLVDSFPFSSHLNSNYIPSEKEAVQIKGHLTEARTQLLEIKAEIDPLQAKVNTLKVKYNNLHHHFDACAALITLPRCLPYEVLGEIFYQTLPTDRNALLCKNSVPLILTRICRQWRQVAFSTPRLWSAIHINVIAKPRNLVIEIEPITTGDEPLPQKWHEVRATAASEWLQRSNNLPLHISFKADNKQFASRALADLYLRSIVPFSSRWKSLVLDGLLVFFPRISALKTADLRSLDSLILDLDPPQYPGQIQAPEEDTPSWSKCGLFTSPSLRKLSIRGIMPTRPTDWGVDRSQLTHLELTATMFSMSRASHILHLSKRLIYCRIKITGQEFSSNIRFMRLPFLRSFSIVMQGRIPRFTEKLEVPALQQIGLHVINDDWTGYDIDYTTCLAPLLRSEQETIQKLVIDTRYLSHKSFLDILRKCPNLKSLTLKLASGSYPRRRGKIPPIRIDDEFLENISKDDSDVLCSQLEEFTCEYHADFSATGMIGFIKRKQHGSPKLAKLKKITTVLPNSEKYPLNRPVLADELQPYISQGLVFHIFFWQIQGSRCFCALWKFCCAICRFLGAIGHRTNLISHPSLRVPRAQYPKLDVIPERMGPACRVSWAWYRGLHGLLTYSVGICLTEFILGKIKRLDPLP